MSNDFKMRQHYAWAKFSIDSPWHVVRVLRRNEDGCDYPARVIDTTGAVRLAEQCLEISDPIAAPDGKVYYEQG